MTITLTADQEARLGALVAAGEFDSVEEAAQALLDGCLAQLGQFAGDDMAWAKPYLDEAEADVARGALLTLEEHEADMDAYLADMK